MTENAPKCPWCKTNKHVRLTGFRHHYCGRCGREFDGEDDGEVGYDRPDERLTRQEEVAKRRKERKQMRSGR